MGLKSFFIAPFAKQTAKNIDAQAQKAVECQRKIFDQLIQRGSATAFGKDHSFEQINNHRDFVERVPVQEYEGIKQYVERIMGGEKDVLWPGVPKYLAKTSGTTSGIKYIPITKASMPNHIGTARNALFNHCYLTRDYSIFDGKMIFLSGSPTLEKPGKVPIGRLSGIVNHEIPSWLQTNQLPSKGTNMIEDWEHKVETIAQETIGEDLRLISGIPPWVLMYYEVLLKKTGRSTIKEIFPNYNLFIYGGVDFSPYRSKLESLVGEQISSLETYPASEGFIAFQDRPDHQGLLLNVDSGIFFEFIPLDEFHNKNPARLTVGEVEAGVNYVLVLSNNAGLWGYNLGDTVKFLSVYPPRLIVTGRVKHFISAFGEHVIGKEVDMAMARTARKHNVNVVEFTVAPNVNPPEKNISAYHEWFVEFDKIPDDILRFSADLNKEMIHQNIYYRDLIDGKILQPLKLRTMRKSTFRDYMESKGKLGGQNKVPHLSNDRKLVEDLYPFVVNQG